MNNDKKYDYIIAGMGCAGLSLAIQLKRSSLKFSKVLLIDKDLKNKNDRTWCFWTKEKNNWFDKIVYNRWDKFLFKSSGFEKEIELHPYSYLMIKGIDFYDFCLKELKTDSRFEIITDEIQEINTIDSQAVLKTKNHFLSCDYLFNSAVRTLNKKTNHINYVQHFKGWLLETEIDSFNVDCPVFMDFTVEQHNDCRFIYIIPFSKTKALVEYTGFSAEKLSDEFYDGALKNYIEKKLNIASYKIKETEKGEIPMVESDFTNPFGNRVINIGTAGGSSKPSTGYTFYFIQKNTKNIVAQLENGTKEIITPKRAKRFLLYDKILLHVLDKKEIEAKQVFTTLFQKNKVTNLLAFLNEESSFAQDVAIMNSVSKKHFIKATIKKLTK
ncbi:MAG: lycopene cyclase family protein [Bacteroidota bacterium]|nr:lycopene cyclase family protein [Bacteroidota bacterium]MDP3146965.1 lycopene cyclase family protein [Bacteroidota bacterium]